jgi:hypothetical protein
MEVVVVVGSVVFVDDALLVVTLWFFFKEEDGTTFDDSIAIEDGSSWVELSRLDVTDGAGEASSFWMFSFSCLLFLIKDVMVLLLLKYFVGMKFCEVKERREKRVLCVTVKYSLKGNLVRRK